MTTHHTDDQRVEQLLAPLADIPPVPHRGRRVAAPRPWLRPALVAAACLTVVIAAGAAIVTSGGGTSRPAGTTPAATVPIAADLRVYFLRGGELVPVAVPDPVGGDPAPRRALEALLAGPAAGFETAVVPGTALESFSVADTIATIKLSGRTPVDRGLEQIVATLTDFDDINWVRFGGEEGLVDRTLASGAVDAAPPIELVRAQLKGQMITFAGTADTFEANVQLRVMQGTKQLATTFVTATCGTGCRGSFEGTINVPAGTAPDALNLEAFTLSAKDGSVQDVVGRDVTPAP